MASSTPNLSESNAPQSIWSGDDRRAARRRSIDLSATLLRHRWGGRSDRFPVCTVHMHDLSSTGVGATCNAPFERLEPITICIPPHGADQGFDLPGRVVRCEPNGQGMFDLGIELAEANEPARVAA